MTSRSTICRSDAWHLAALGPRRMGGHLVHDWRYRQSHYHGATERVLMAFRVTSALLGAGIVAGALNLYVLVAYPLHGGCW